MKLSRNVSMKLEEAKEKARHLIKHEAGRRDRDLYMYSMEFYGENS